WGALVAGLLTRPQMVVFGFLLGLVFLRKFSWRRNMRALSWTTILTFIFLAPLTLRSSPSLPIDILIHNLQVQQGGGNSASLTTVSQDAYSIWPLVTYLAQGASGLGRSFTQSSASLIGPLTYQRFGQLLTGVALLVVAAVIASRRRVTD